MIGSYFRRKKREQEISEMKETAKNIAIGSAVGSAIGIIAGILLAPKSGEETRQDISKKATDMGNSVKDAVDEGLEATKEFQEKIITEIEKFTAKEDGPCEEPTRELEGQVEIEEDLMSEEVIEDETV